MEKHKVVITHERLLDVMEYDPETGIARWRDFEGRRKINAGDIMGSVSSTGHLRVKIDYKDYLLHILIFFYMTGRWPNCEIDHADVDYTNNKWGNLREATRSQNAANRRLQSNNSTGLIGVYKNTLKYGDDFVARITTNGKVRHIGYFNCPAAAAFAYQIEADKAFREFARW